MTTDDFINNTPAKMEAYKRICEGVNEDQKAISNKPTMNWIDEKVEEFDEQFVPTDWLVASAHERMSGDAGINNGIAMYHTIRIKDWLRTALQEAHQRGVDETTKNLEDLAEVAYENGTADGMKLGAELERKRVLEWVAINSECLDEPSERGFVNADDLINFINKV